ncbi:MAG: DUF4198 domain-containing protein [Calditrichaeota bacterium]|nr:DUF4198 domain-containing protein [Calditrichota bacterium]
MKRILFCTFLIFFFGISNISYAHHQIAYLAPFNNNMVAFISSGHRLPIGEKFAGLKRYDEALIIDPSGKKIPIQTATDMGAFGFSVMPSAKKGLYILSIGAEHYGTKTTEGYFIGTKKEAIKAGRKVIESKHTFRYSKSYRWNGKGAAPELKVGHAIEIVPDTMPEVLKQGDQLPVTLYFMGKPAANMIIGVNSMTGSDEIGHPDETDKFLTTYKTDANGKVVLKMSDSGWMIFMAEKLIKNPEPDVDKLFYSTTLTLWVEK